MTAIYLITGFLGAGKTTFLKGRLASTHSRTGVLVNDFGKVNFDGQQIKQDGLEMIELSNGSIFCSCLKDYFIDGLAHLVEKGLDEIYIESSGLADPSDMGRILDLVRLKKTHGTFVYKGSICLIDALFFPKVLPKMLAVERQIRHSHLVILNKCDLVDSTQLANVRQVVRQLNPRAGIIETIFGQVEWDTLDYEVFDITDEETTNKIETRNKNLILHFLHEPDPATLRAFLEAIASHFFRVKGMVHLDGQLQKIDQVNQQIQIEAYDGTSWSGETDQLVCLTSQGIDSISHLARMADQYLPGTFRLEM